MAPNALCPSNSLGSSFQDGYDDNDDTDITLGHNGNQRCAHSMHHAIDDDSDSFSIDDIS